ncbi:NUDIX domain-containing protein [Candidatus Parcubacteria bacterium]|nr:NUDIX domain-containing protein [Candidatus Parcubacteria bacterium]
MADTLATAEKSTLVFPIRNGVVWLAEKKRKVGAGLLNGYGGKLDEADGGSIRLCACREFREESGVSISPGAELQKMAIVRFFEEAMEIFECHVYFVDHWEGELRETEQMGRPESHPLWNVPYHLMMPADAVWLKLVFAGRRFKGNVYYGAGNKEFLKFEEAGPL